MTTNPPIRTTEQISRQRRQMVVAAVAMLMASAACVAIAPMLMPDSYSVVEHSISESAAQGVAGAWLARLGLLLLGFAVLTSASIAGERWGVWGRLTHRIYGVSMLGAAAFAHMPWEDVPYDAFEDLLHSFAAYGIGFAFTAGVLIVTFRRGPGMRSARVFDWIAIVAAVVIPMTMFNVTGVAGLVQRIMFGIGYLWYGLEAIRSGRRDDPFDQPVTHETPQSLAGAVCTSTQEAAQ